MKRVTSLITDGADVDYVDYRVKHMAYLAHMSIV